MVRRPQSAAINGKEGSDVAAPTYEDAQLMVQLARWGTELGVGDAIPRILADDFDPDSADVLTDEAVRTLLLFGESIGTLTKHNLLSAELVHDWLWVEGIWARVASAAMRQRDRFREPRLYENFEALAGG
jgi:hypothetical protein